jgi:hypothetical protein
MTDVLENPQQVSPASLTKNKKLIICIPQEKFMHVEAVQSLLAIQSGLMSRGWKVVILFDTGYNLAFLRNKLAERALHENEVEPAPFILWLDSDMKVSALDVFKLMKSLVDSKLDFLSAKYHIRGMKDQLCAFNFNLDGAYDKCMPDVGQCGILGLDGVGFGCLMMTPTKLIELSTKVDLPFRSSDAEPIGEDLLFCQQARAHGFTIGMDCDIWVGHYSVVAV